MESPSPLARYIPQKSKKRVFPGSSTSYVDPEAVEISPHVQWSSKSNSLKQKEVVNPDVIDIDMDDEDSGGAVLVNEKIEAQNTKGKEALTSFPESHNNLAKSGTVDEVQSSKESAVPGPHNSVILEGFSYDNSYGDDDYMEMYHDELTYDDKYAFMQAHFDSMDIPPGVEAPIPWFHSQIKDNPAHANSSNHTIVPSQLDTPGSDFLHSWGLLEPAQTGKKLTSWSDFHGMEQSSSWPLPESAHTNWNDFNVMEQSSSLPLPESAHTNWSDFHGMEQSSSWPLPESAHTKWKSAVPTISTDFSSPIESGATNLPAGLDPYGMEHSSSWLLPESAHTKWKSAVPTISTHFGSHMESGATNLPPGLDPWRVPVFSYGKKKPAVSGSATNYTSHNQPGTNKPSSVVDPSKVCRSNRLKKLVGKSSLTYSRFSAMDPMNLAPGVDAYMSGWHVSSEFTSPEPFMGDNSFYSFDPVPIPTEDELYAPWLKYPAKSQTRATAAGTSTVPFGASNIEKHGDETEILKKFQHFKQFDTVQDHSDHRYSCNGHLVKQPPKNWTKKIQEEWRILEKDLPDMIFVRVYESRMDLMRAAIIGAEGTPYHDGLFFFDVFFPCGYPNVPPHVYYHSGGLRINPNLYNCGKVCLSLLNTWGGSQNEKWIPGVSTMLQVLVSIQALILNAKPYFNEPGYARMSGSANGEKNSQQYNESTFILSLKTMVYNMRRPPKHFEDFVAGHFCKRAHDILVACKAYMNGAQVGCLASGGVQDVDAGDKSCSKQFKGTLAGWLNSLVQAFSQIGAKDCEKFLSPAEQAILQNGATDTNWGEGQGES